MAVPCHGSHLGGQPAAPGNQSLTAWAQLPETAPLAPSEPACRGPGTNLPALFLTGNADRACQCPTSRLRIRPQPCQQAASYLPGPFLSFLGNKPACLSIPHLEKKQRPRTSQPCRPLLLGDPPEEYKQEGNLRVLGAAPSESPRKLSWKTSLHTCTQGHTPTQGQAPWLGSSASKCS